MWDKHSNDLFKKLGLEHRIQFQASQTTLQLSKAVKFDSLLEDYIDKKLTQLVAWSMVSANHWLTRGIETYMFLS